MPAVKTHEKTIKIILDNPSHTEYEGEILNINSRSMTFLCDKKIDDNNIYFFSFVLKNENRMTNIKGKIVGQNQFGTKYLTVLVFFSIPKVEMLAIYKYIEKANEI